MSFRVTQKTLERLEWPRVMEDLAGECRTPQARMHLHAPAHAESSDRSTDGPFSSLTRADAYVEGESADASKGALAADTIPQHHFEQTLFGTRERLTETSEARALLDSSPSSSIR